MKMIEKTSKKGMLKVIIICMLIVVIVVLVGIAFARYITSLNGNASMNIAKWSFNYRILNSTQTAEVENFAVTRKDNNEDVDPNTIAPGTSGEFIIEIDATRNRNIINI